MHAFVSRLFGPRRLLIVVAAIAVGTISAAQAAVTSYMAIIDGVTESPPNASPGTGLGTVVIDDVLHTMHLHATFSGMLGPTSASHIHAATAVAVIHLRRTRPEVPRPYRTWGYPWVPILFAAASAAFVTNTLIERPLESFLGLGLVALGLPAYAWWRRRR